MPLQKLKLNLLALDHIVVSRAQVPHGPHPSTILHAPELIPLVDMFIGHIVSDGLGPGSISQSLKLQRFIATENERNDKPWDTHGGEKVLVTLRVGDKIISSSLKILSSDKEQSTKTLKAVAFRFSLLQLPVK